MAAAVRQSGPAGDRAGWAERMLERQRDQLPLWLPVAFGIGIAAWFVLPDRASWMGWCAMCAAVATFALLLPAQGRARRVVMIAALTALSGCAVAWLRADSVAAPVLARTMVATFEARIEAVELQPARDRARLTLAPDPDAGLPPRIRVNADLAALPSGVAPGERIGLRARLMAPAAAAVPGGFDFARVAWFQGLGATGSALGPIARTGPAATTPDGLRARLSRHIHAQLAGSAGGIASAFASGDRGGIDVADEEAMRDSGLTHLLSVSGLHITAVVGATMFLALRLLALSPFLAARLPLPMAAAAIAAAAGIGYTLLTGAEVPTVRSCVAALLVLAGIAIGRQAFTLRLVATGAIVVLALWPESLIGPSFQLSFAAVTTIVALHEWRAMRALLARRDEGPAMRALREALGLLLTGIAVELALAPIALFHFHRQGLFGALANIVAIPLTTFVTMPLEALALLFDTIGLGRPFWWLTGLSLDLLLWMARSVAAWPGAVASLASVPQGAYALMIGGGLWLMLWHGGVRVLGLMPIAAGCVWALLTPAPDLLVTGDGMHVAFRMDDGRLAILRPRAGDYVRSVLAERSGELGDLADIDAMPDAVCSADLCRIDVMRGERHWRIVATRSRYLLPYRAFRAECAGADIIVSDRRLPDWCTPHWLKADRAMLARTGGLAIGLSPARVQNVAEGEGDHPWVAKRNDERFSKRPHQDHRRPGARQVSPLVKSGDGFPLPRG